MIVRVRPPHEVHHDYVQPSFNSAKVTKPRGEPGLGNQSMCLCAVRLAEFHDHVRVARCPAPDRPSGIAVVIKRFAVNQRATFLVGHNKRRVREDGLCILILVVL